MVQIKKISIYIGLLFASLLAGCGEKLIEGPDSPAEMSEVLFMGRLAAAGGGEVETRTITPSYTMFGTNKSYYQYDTIFVRMSYNASLSKQQAIYETGTAVITGSLSVTEGEELKWHSFDGEHTFNAWTVPDKQPETSTETDGNKDANSGLEENPSYSFTYGGGGDDRYLEDFLVAYTKTSYKEQGNAVMLTFKHPICKIILDSLTVISRDGQMDKTVSKCTVEFPNLYNSATFYPLKYTDDTDDTNDDTLGSSEWEGVLVTTGDPEGIKWEWEKKKKTEVSTTGASTTPVKKSDDLKATLYLHPFKFKDDSKSSTTSDHQQPGYFIVTASSKTSSEDKEEIKTYRANLGDLINNDGSTAPFSTQELGPGTYMKLHLILKQGEIFLGSGSKINGWNYEDNSILPHPEGVGVHNQSEAQEFLDALKNGKGIPEYLVEEKGDKKYIHLFDNVDWSKSGLTSLKIPEGYILDGNGFQLKLPTNCSVDSPKEQLIDIYIKSGTSNVQYFEDEKPEGGIEGVD